jgi:hypothetical protein
MAFEFSPNWADSFLGRDFGSQWGIQPIKPDKSLYDPAWIEAKNRPLEKLMALKKADEAAKAKELGGQGIKIEGLKPLHPFQDMTNRALTEISDKTLAAGNYMRGRSSIELSRDPVHQKTMTELSRLRAILTTGLHPVNEQYKNYLIVRKAMTAKGDSVYDADTAQATYNYDTLPLNRVDSWQSILDAYSRTPDAKHITQKHTQDFLGGIEKGTIPRQVTSDEYFKTFGGGGGLRQIIDKDNRKQYIFTSKGQTYSTNNENIARLMSGAIKELMTNTDVKYRVADESARDYFSKIKNVDVGIYDISAILASSIKDKTKAADATKHIFNYIQGNILSGANMGDILTNPNSALLKEYPELKNAFEFDKDIQKKLAGRTIEHYAQEKVLDQYSHKFESKLEQYATSTFGFNASGGAGGAGGTRGYQSKAQQVALGLFTGEKSLYQVIDPNRKDKLDMEQNIGISYIDEPKDKEDFIAIAREKALTHGGIILGEKNGANTALTIPFFNGMVPIEMDPNEPYTVINAYPIYRDKDKGLMATIFVKRPNQVATVENVKLTDDNAFSKQVNKWLKRTEIGVSETTNETTTAADELTGVYTMDIPDPSNKDKNIHFEFRKVPHPLSRFFIKTGDMEDAMEKYARGKMVEGDKPFDKLFQWDENSLSDLLSSGNIRETTIKDKEGKEIPGFVMDLHTPMVNPVLQFFKEQYTGLTNKGTVTSFENKLRPSDI